MANVFDIYRYNRVLTPPGRAHFAAFVPHQLVFRDSACQRCPPRRQSLRVGGISTPGSCAGRAELAVGPARRPPLRVRPRLPDRPRPPCPSARAAPAPNSPSAPRAGRACCSRTPPPHRQVPRPARAHPPAPACSPPPTRLRTCVCAPSSACPLARRVVWRRPQDRRPRVARIPYTVRTRAALSAGRIARRRPTLGAASLTPTFFGDPETPWTSV